jgi:hypothetical protein
VPHCLSEADKLERRGGGGGGGGGRFRLAWQERAISFTLMVPKIVIPENFSGPIGGLDLVLRSLLPPSMKRKRFQVHVFYHILKMQFQNLQMVPLCLIWCLWRERNDRSFEDQERTLEELKSFFFHSLFSLDCCLFSSLSD